MHLLILFSTFLTFGLVYGTELCKEKEYYDDLTGKCRRCQTCKDKSWEVAPCAAFMDTFCVDLGEIRRSLVNNIEAGQISGSLVNNIKAGEKAINDELKIEHHRKQQWHEMEGSDVIKPAPDNVNEIPVSKNLFDSSFDQWDMMFMTILCLLFLFFVVFLIMGTVRYYGNPLHWDHSKVTRARWFSRDRLNTTEYMNNLATLDRRLTLDEILEKKKRAAIFEPQLLNENLYSDDVFVDISGLPRNLRNSHDYEEIDHKKCLLEMQDRQ